MLQVLAHAGRLTEAGGAVQTGLALAEQTGQRFMDAELHRLHGEIVLATAAGGVCRADDDRAAESSFRRSLEVARGQEARSLELRAAMSLARMQKKRGECDAAHQLLAPLYARFTEGFETADLIEARALLDELR